MDVSSAAAASCGLFPSLAAAVRSKGEMMVASSGREGFVVASTMDFVPMRQFRRGGTDDAPDSFTKVWLMSDDPIDDDADDDDDAASDDRLFLSGWRRCRMRAM